MAVMHRHGSIDLGADHRLVQGGAGRAIRILGRLAGPGTEPCS